MQVTITIPQNIINTCQECGWEEQEIAILFKAFLNRVVEHPYNQFEIDFEGWLEDQDEEELGDLFRIEQELEVGMQVEIVKNLAMSDNQVGDVGVIIAIEGTFYRVQVEGRGDANFQCKEDIARVNY